MCPAVGFDQRLCVWGGGLVIRLDAHQPRFRSPVEARARCRKPLAHPPDDAGLVQIVRRHLELDAITDRKTNPTFAHLAGDRGEHEMFVGQFDTKHRAWQHSVNAAFNFNGFFFHVQLFRFGAVTV